MAGKGCGRFGEKEDIRRSGGKGLEKSGRRDFIKLEIGEAR